jgi:hypothetical protein
MEIGCPLQGPRAQRAEIIEVVRADADATLTPGTRYEVRQLVRADFGRAIRKGESGYCWIVPDTLAPDWTAGDFRESPRYDAPTGTYVVMRAVVP